MNAASKLRWIEGSLVLRQHEADGNCDCPLCLQPTDCAQGCADGAHWCHLCLIVLALDAAVVQTRDQIDESEHMLVRLWCVSREVRVPVAGLKKQFHVLVLGVCHDPLFE